MPETGKQRTPEALQGPLFTIQLKVVQLRWKSEFIKIPRCRKGTRLCSKNTINKKPISGWNSFPFINPPPRLDSAHSQQFPARQCTDGHRKFYYIFLRVGRDHSRGMIYFIITFLNAFANLSIKINFGLFLCFSAEWGGKKGVIISDERSIFWWTKKKAEVIQQLCFRI